MLNVIHSKILCSSLKQNKFLKNLNEFLFLYAPQLIKKANKQARQKGYF